MWMLREIRWHWPDLEPKTLKTLLQDTRSTDWLEALRRSEPTQSEAPGSSLRLRWLTTG